MKIIKTEIADVILIRPKVFTDQRGDFRETYQDKRYKEAGIECDFVQDNLVHSKQNVFRGMHFQTPPFEQAKLITMIKGEIIDFITDLRKDSKTYLKTIKVKMSAKD